jgi:hypothetical protein
MKPSKNDLRDVNFTDDPKEKIKKDIFAKFRDMKAKVGHTIPSKWLTLRYYHSLTPKEQEYFEIAIKELVDEGFIDNNMGLKQKGYDKIY